MKQNMVQMLNIILALPGIVADLVQSYDKKWKTFLLLREITVILMAEKINKCSISYLRETIADFLTMYKLNFEQNLTAKFHFLTHYPMIIGKVGPIRHFMALRLEGKHRILKKLAVTSNNFKNICFTLSKRHQISFAYRCLTKKGLFDDLVEEPGRSVRKAIGDIAGIEASQLARYFQDTTTEISLTKKLLLNGVEFVVGKALYFGTPGFYPRFFEIKAIIVHGSLILFMGCFLQILYFHRHLQAYIVSPNTPVEFKLRERREMRSPWSFFVRTQRRTGLRFVALTSNLH